MFDGIVFVRGSVKKTYQRNKKNTLKHYLWIIFNINNFRLTINKIMQTDKFFKYLFFCTISKLFAVSAHIVT